ncbi:3-methyladenine DNA glycosylase [Streptomyces varsoviensis]|uniref:3-methyladenine DNA glycosylase n=1 Tax=Streptomyces varsoviensis TaxID=67373 RepID=A0ABR5J530_9ACTN|nr:3-methyladenine DNA glycosylase [Streptomyces varsoviensis]
MSGVAFGPDGVARCPWGMESESMADYRAYHDTEWGRPVRGDDALYERMCLEAFQSGLSWITILRRREGFRAAFADFRIEKVAAFTDADAERLLADPGIIAAELPAGELTELIWSYAPERAGRPAPRTVADVPPLTPESTALAKDLKKRGFRFIGPTTAYALMQACGLVNDHLAACHVREAVERA